MIKFHVDTTYNNITIPIYLSQARRKSSELLGHLLNTCVLDTEGCLAAVEGLQTIDLTPEHTEVPK